MGFFDFLKSKTNSVNDWKKTLVKDMAILTAVDGDMDKDELKLLLNIAVNELGFSEKEFINLLQNLGDVKDIYPTVYEDKIKYMISLMKITYSDGYLDDNEIKYMKIIAKNMALSDNIVKEIILIIESQDMNDLQKLNLKLKNFLLPNEMQAQMYDEVRKISFYSKKFIQSRSQDDNIKFQEVVVHAFESVILVYEWLQKKEISELNGIVLLTSFYLVNLSDMKLKDPNSFTDDEIINTINTFLKAMGGYGNVDTSSYNELVRIGINWLFLHPKE